MFKDFKKFAIKSTMVELAVGIIIAGAFGKIISSFVTDIILPPFGLLLGDIDFSNFNIVLKQATETTQAVTINYGLFINTIINFIIITFAIFIMIKQINKLREEDKKLEPSEDTLLLREIRNYLKK